MALRLGAVVRVEVYEIVIVDWDTSPRMVVKLHDQIRPTFDPNRAGKGMARAIVFAILAAVEDIYG